MKGRKRWLLIATPEPNAEYPELSDQLARKFNETRQRFYTLNGAEQAVHYYRVVLGLPVELEVIDRREWDDER